MSSLRLSPVPTIASRIEDGVSHLVAADDPGAATGALRILGPMDAVMPRTGILVVYIFEAASPSASTGPSYVLLERAMARALAEYPELAGRLEHLEEGRRLGVRLNNAGALLANARCPHPLSALRPYRTESLPECIASKIDPAEVEKGTSPLLQIRRTEFECGGVTVAIAMHHSLADADAFFQFVNDLAATARALATNCDVMLPPVISDRSLQTPPADARPQLAHAEYRMGDPMPAMSLEFMAEAMKSMPAMRTADFVLSRAELDAMKHAAAGERREEGGGAWVSTNDAVAGHMWAAVTRARWADPNAALHHFPVSRCGIACNGRWRLRPPLPPRYFGNSNYFACAEMPTCDLIAASDVDVAAATRAAVARMDDAYLRDAAAFVQSQPDVRAVLPSFNMFLGPDVAVTNWARYDLYACDFGGGAPAYVGIGHARFDGLFIIMPAAPSAGPGALKVTLGLHAAHMATLLADERFRPFRHLTATPLL